MAGASSEDPAGYRSPIADIAVHLPMQHWLILTGFLAAQPCDDTVVHSTITSVADQVCQATDKFIEMAAAGAKHLADETEEKRKKGHQD
jgi:hypothetical protein